MDIKMLSKRYSTPTYIKAILSILFIGVFVLMVALPVFELIPQSQYINVFNLQGVAKGPYDAQTYTIFSMMQNDYGSGLAMGIMMGQCIASVIFGIALIWVNRPKMAIAPAAIMLWTIVFSVFRATQTAINKNVPAKLFSAPEFWDSVNKNIQPINGSPDQATGFVQQYTVNGEPHIFNMLGQYWMLWVAGFVLLACAIVAIAVTKTLVEKEKK